MHANPALRTYVQAHAENRPGVYRFWGPGRELLYVGKSVRVRSRILSYFTAPRGEKAWELAREAADVDWDYVPNEFAALLTEMRQIQAKQPRFNVEHRRKPIYAFIKVTRDMAPRIVPTSRVAADGATYFGPVPRVGALARIVRELSHLLGLRDCPASTPVFFQDQLEIFSGGRPPKCLRAELRTCLAPCCGRPTALEYHEAVELARRFLEGSAAGPLKDLKMRMHTAARRLDFEYAAVLRDRLERLQAFRDELVAFRGRVEDLTFLYRVPGFRGDDRLYFIRRGRVHSALPYPKDRRTRERVREAISRVYRAPSPGPEGLSPSQAAEILLVARWFRRRPKERKRTLPPSQWLERKAVV
ncbi:MAG: UvrB/UvrC motif-containing protein [Gemmatimonadota bacterium]